MERDLKCMYCAEAGITNTDVFIEIVDEELGLGWICKECFLESEKEKDKHLKELEDQLKLKEQECEFSNLKIIQLQETLSQYETDLSTKDCIVETCKAQYKELKAENDLFRTCHDNEQAKRRKLEQTLTEIKEIIQFNKTNRLSGGACISIEQILQRISEVEE